MLLYNLENQNLFLNLEQIVAIIKHEEMDVYAITMSCGQSVEVPTEEALLLLNVLGHHNKQTLLAEQDQYKPEITE